MPATGNNPFAQLPAHDLKSAAQQLADAGYAVFPMVGKKPTIKKWQQSVPPTPETIERWHKEGRLKNIGIALGERNATPLVVIDFDNWPGYEAFCEHFPQLADTLTIASGSGNGAHVYFHVTTMPETSRAMETPLGNIELKGNGQSVVVPPSIHPISKRPYTIHRDRPILHVPTLDEVVAWVNAHKLPRPVPPRRAPLRVVSGNHTERYIQVALEGELHSLRGIEKGERNYQLYISSLKLFGFVKGGYLGETDVRQQLYSAAEANGLLHDDGESAVLATIESAWNSANPRAIPEPPPPPNPPVKPDLLAPPLADAQPGFQPLDPVTPDQIINTEYVTNLDLEPFVNRVTGIQAGTGQGKTTLATKLGQLIRAKNPKARFLIVTRNRQTAEKLADVFRAVGLTVTFYLDATDPDQLYDYDCLAICINSLPKIEREGRVKPVDYLFVDESETMHAAFDDDTFDGFQSTQAFRVYSELLRRTPTILLADATLSSLTLRLPKALGREVFHIQNVYQPRKRQAYRYVTQQGISYEFRERLALDNGLVVAGWDNKALAEAEADLLSAIYGRDQVLLITADTVCEPRVQAFLYDTDAEVEPYRAILFTSVIANGFDFQMPCADLFIFQIGAEFDAPNIIQMVGRFRQAETLHIYQPKTNPGRETDWGKRFNQRVAEALRTGQLNFAQVLGANWASPEMHDTDDLRLLGMVSYAEAMHNHSLNHLQAHTDALLSRQWNIRPNADYFPQDEDEDVEQQAINQVKQRAEQAKNNRESFTWLISTANPVSEAAYAEHVRNQTADRDVRAGYIRWQIEQIFNTSKATPDLVAAYAEGVASQGYNYLRYTRHDVPHLMRRDFEEMKLHYALKKRKHQTNTHKMLRLFLFMVFGQYELDAAIEVEKPEMARRFAAFMDAHGDAFHNLMNWRRSHSQDPVKVVNRVLKLFGLKLKRRQAEKKTKTYYHIDEDSLRRIQAFAVMIDKTYAPPLNVPVSESA